MAEQEFNKSEKATPYKLKKAKEKGQVSKSIELNGFMVLSAFTLVVIVLGQGQFMNVLQWSSGLLRTAGNVSIPSGLYHLFLYLMTAVFSLMIPFILVLLMSSMISTVMQTGFVWSFQPLKPDFSRLNPITGFKRLFNVRLLFECVKNVLKIGIYGTVIYWVIRGNLPRILQLLQTFPNAYPKLLMHEVEQLLWHLLLAVGFIAILDWLFVRWQYGKQQRMSVRDIRDEIKHREGDPLVRSKIKQLQRELRKRSASVSRVKEADVLITNPTHLAVALKYDRSQMIAPKLIAKGSGEVAQQMKQIAVRHQVPIIEDKPLAQDLFKQIDVNGTITEIFYPTVARILTQIYREKERK